jgi:membrane protein
MFDLLKSSIMEFIEDDCPTMAAALSYYTVFALPPLLVLLLLLAGAVVNPEDLRGTIQTQMQALMGPKAAATIPTILQHAQLPGSHGVIATVLGVLVLAIGATGFFGQLQAALNRAWEVKPDPHQGGIKNFLMKRVFSFGMILALALLLLVSLVLSALFAAFGGALGRFLPEGISVTVLQVFNFVLSFGLITLLFAAVYRVLPDARIRWRDVWVGAAATAFLFVIGKTLLGLYLGHSNPGEAFGAAGSLALLLVWIYYSSMIVLLGAEFTQIWADRRGAGVQPEPGAVRMKREAHAVPAPQGA